VAELVEERRLAKGNTGQQNAPRTLSRDDGASSALERVRRAARKDKGARFTALLHHVGLDRLRAAYAAISPKAAPGVDQVTWAAYGQDLRANLEDLLRRVHSGAYRASPSRRVYIPKPDGRQRPLGIATLEDKIVRAPRAQEGEADVGRRPLTDCAAVWEMKDWWPFGVALRGVASNRLMLH